jgi:Cyanobacterial TRADD-N associated 2-Transmembrane domain
MKGARWMERTDPRAGQCASSKRSLKNAGRYEATFNLDQYHSVGLSQARIAFRLSIAFAGLGALVVLAGAVKLLFFADDHAAMLSGVYTAVCGTIAETVAALLLLQADRANRRMTEFFDRGRRDRDLAAAQQIAAGLADRTIGVWLQVTLALLLAGCATDSAPIASASTLNELPGDSVHGTAGSEGIT